MLAEEFVILRQDGGDHVRPVGFEIERETGENRR